MALTEDDLQTLLEEGIDTSNPGIYEELLLDLQGNILKGHGRDHTVHLFLQFKPGQVEPLKDWIREFAKNITSAHQQAAEAELYRTEKIAGKPFINFFLSHAGYEYLQFRPFQIPGNQPFRFGMKNDTIRNLLGDPVIEEWEPGLQEEIHALLLIADDNLVSLLQTVNQITRTLYLMAQVVHREDGFILKNEKGDHIEHFGFIDGISQPLFTKSDIQKAKTSDDFSKWDPRAPLSLVLAKDPNGKSEDSYGSYLVYRKLEQDVIALLDAEKDLAEKLGVDKELAGALMMGRFRDGTPLTLADKPGGDYGNDFDYSEDEKAYKCPFHTHVRKTNPRGDTGRVISSGESFEDALKTERNHRIARRAVSYGETDYTNSTSTGSGLLFLCFQADLENQFNFMQAAWANASNFVEWNVGVDPIIGQTGPGADRNQKWPVAWGKPEKSDQSNTFNFGLWVHMKGGEYFFAPSISSLTSI